MQIWKYEVDDWKVEQWTSNLEISRRAHRLFTIHEELDLSLFAPIRKANEDEFLEAHPGFIVCGGIWVSLFNTITDAADPSQMIEDQKKHVWLLRYDFTEQFPTSWNELLHPAPGGKAIREKHDIVEPFNMTAFFGASRFQN